ncbi:unnamed protein product [Ambrosiozyma monospora]|uniref:Unnamed protein product n=1 Tax=Ambrosiozyma monospora TaxID=43982 RepID=A0ACB5SRK6_AMBMO|nr:unnamed protein product [Ambrosiozyma monospora]
MTDIATLLKGNKKRKITVIQASATRKPTFNRVKKHRVTKKPTKHIPTPPHSSQSSQPSSDSSVDDNSDVDEEKQNKKSLSETSSCQIDAKKEVKVEEPAEDQNEDDEYHPRKRSRRMTSQKQKQKLVQTHFKTKMDKISCEECGMSYLPYVKADQQQHHKFHKRVLEGLDFSTKASQGKHTFSYFLNKPETKHHNKQIDIYELNFKNQYNVQLAHDFLGIVNTELNAPQDTLQFLKGPNFGKVFLAVDTQLGKTVGIISVERIKTGHWMIADTGDLVPNQTMKLLLGISRIYVCKQYRGYGIGLKLCQVLFQNGVYGVALRKTQIGWSQPSEFGGRLALRFNAVKHKSGKFLIPVYKEEEDLLESEVAGKDLKKHVKQQVKKENA